MADDWGADDFHISEDIVGSSLEVHNEIVEKPTVCKFLNFAYCLTLLNNFIIPYPGFDYPMRPSIVTV